MSGGRGSFTADERTSEEYTRAVAAGKLLAEAGHRNTAESCVVEVDPESGELEVAELPENVSRAAACLLKAGEACGQKSHVLRLPPMQGLAVVFFNSVADEARGHVPDFMSWHGGASVAGNARSGKWTVQCFESIPEQVVKDGSGAVRRFLESQPLLQS